MKKSNKTKRVCQPCTACCDGWVRMVIDGVAVYPGHPCPHSTGSGCDDYQPRPVDPCRNFNCGWIQQGSPLPDELRPDLGGVMVLPAVRHWWGHAVDVAVPVGREIPQASLDWLKQFALQQQRPLLYLEQDSGEADFRPDQNVVAFGPPEFQQMIMKLIEAGERLW